MIHRAEGPGPGVPRIWILPISIVVLALGSTAAGLLSRSLVLDLVAWWPVWFVLLVLALAFRGRRAGRVRLAGLVPILATIGFVVFLAAHLAGWAIMPSAVPTLVGPAVDPTETAEMTARVDGRLSVGSDASFLYEVNPIRYGGEVGVPGASEESGEGSVRVTLNPSSEPGFYGFRGWELQLSPLVSWNLVLEGTLNANLSGLSVSALQISGEGSAVLAEPEKEASLDVIGDYEVVIADSIAARLIGDGVVPDTWIQTTDGWKSPADGDGWVISVSEGGSLTVSSG